MKLYTTQISLSASYRIAESNVNRTTHKIENILVKFRRFVFPPKAVMIENESFNWAIIDSNETEIERQKKAVEILYQKKKRHMSLITPKASKL